MDSIQETKFLFNPKTTNVQEEMNSRLLQLLKSSNKRYKKIAIACIGTDTTIGDSFGPLVGLHIEQNDMYNFEVYGTLYDQLHAKNLEERLSVIDNTNTLVIAIDASFGNIKNIGCVQMGHGSIKPGSGVGKDLIAVGDIYIIGIANTSTFGSLMGLQYTPLGRVYRMMEATVKAVNYALIEGCPKKYRFS